MFRKKTYTEKALKIAAAALEVVDEKIESDLYNHRPDEVPLNHEWQFNGFWDSFSSSKKKLAEKRTSFNIGLMNGVAFKYYDGDARDFEIFLEQAIRMGIAGGAEIVQQIGKVDNKHSKFFSLGSKYSKGFAERHLDEASIEVDRSDVDADVRHTRTQEQTEGADYSAAICFNLQGTIVQEVAELEKLLGAAARFSNTLLSSHYFEQQQTQRYNAYKLWADSEMLHKDKISDAVRTFNRNNLILNQSESANLFKPIEYSLDENFFEMSPLEREQYAEKRAALYDKIQPQHWYASVAQEIISELSEFLKNLKLFLLRFYANGSALALEISSECSGSSDEHSVVSIDKLIERIEDYRFSGEFNIKLIPKTIGSSEYIDIHGWVRHTCEYDRDEGLYRPSGLSVYGGRETDPSSFFYNFISDHDEKLSKFLPKVSTEVVSEDPPKFLTFAIAFESVMFAIQKVKDQEYSFLKNDFSGLGVSKAHKRFSAEIHNSSVVLRIYRIYIVLKGEFDDGHRFSEYISSEQFIYTFEAGTKKIVDFLVTNPRASNGYKVKEWFVVGVDVQ
jgi:hypothetical protein